MPARPALEQVFYPVHKETFPRRYAKKFEIEYIQHGPRGLRTNSGT